MRLARVLAAIIPALALMLSGATAVAGSERGVPRHAARTEEVVFPSGGETLSGVLMLPEGPGGPLPAFAMLHGSGSSSIREALTESFPFWLDVADFLLAKGYAVLAFDKAGVGRSTGDWRTRSFEDRAEEAIAAIEYLRSRPEVDGSRIGLIGHSQGGYIAQLAAARAPTQVAFVISLAGPAVSVKEQILDDMEANWLCSGNPAWLAAARRAGMQLVLGAYQLFSHVASIGYLSRIINYDPGRDLERISQPMLAIFAENDRLVRADKNARLLETHLRRSSSRAWFIRKVPGANHFFRPSGFCGGPSEQPWRWADGFWEALGAEEFWRAVGAVQTVLK